MRLMTISVILLAAVLGSIRSPAARGQVAPAAPAVAAPAAADKTAADKAVADKAARTEALQKVLAFSRDYLVTVTTQWQKDQGEYPEISSQGGSQVYSVSDLVENRQASEDLGMMIDPAKGLVLAIDHNGQTRFIKSVAGLTAQGKPFALQRHGFYLDLDAAVYRTDAWPGKTEAPAWFDGPLDLSGGGHFATLTRDDLGWSLEVTGGGGGSYHCQRTDRQDLDGLQDVSSVGLAFTATAQPVGFTTGTRVSLTGDQYPWRGRDLAGSRLITFEEFATLTDRIKQEVGRYAHEVRIVYRQSEGEEENLTFEGEDPSSLTQYYYGYAISPTRVLVPLKLDKIYIQRFKEISVDLAGKQAPARFLGAYQDFGGFVVEMDGAASPAVLPIGEAPPLPEVNRAMVTYVHHRKFGRRHNKLWYTRLTGYEPGYADRPWPQTKQAMARGMLVLDFGGRPLGLCLVERRLDQEKTGEDGGNWRYARADLDGLQLYRLDQLATALKNPEAHFDPNLRPSSGQDEKRLVWLGVETQTVSPQLAEMLDRMAGSDQVQAQTRKGQKGLRVTLVYPDSPAAKAGLLEGDILLDITEEGKATPIELRAGAYRDRGWGDSWQDYSGLLSRSNYLTRLLTRIGPGTKVTLAYLHGTEAKTRQFTLEWAPYDFESADKYKDLKTGLTVKNLTYDVRALLRLADDQPGVIVAKIEEGEKADIAQIGMLQIITAINGQPVRTIDEYRQAMTAIQGAETGGTAVITVLWMGKSNIVKIEFP